MPETSFDQFDQFDGVEPRSAFHSGVVAGAAPTPSLTAPTSYPVTQSGLIGAFAWRGGRESVPLVSLLECASSDIGELRRRALLLGPLHPVNAALLPFTSAPQLAAVSIQSARTRLATLRKA